MKIKIDVLEFRNRLAQLCLKSYTFSRKLRGQYILLKSIILLFKQNLEYSESGVNNIIKKWLLRIGRVINIDHETAADLFVEGIELMNPEEIVDTALQKTQKRQKVQSQS